MFLFLGGICDCSLEGCSALMKVLAKLTTPEHRDRAMEELFLYVRYSLNQLLIYVQGRPPSVLNGVIIPINGLING